MKQIIVVLLACLLIISSGSINAENKITVRSMPPVIIKTSPTAGNTAVDPSIKEIRIIFSKEMLTHEQWSMVTVTKGSFPKITGNVRFLNDKKTFIAPVELKRGKTYAIWLNKGKFNYFKDKYNNSAIPYLLVFKTKD